MACKERSVQLRDFVEEIDYDEIEKLEVVGKGSFGVVWKGKWCETYVAVKHIDSEAERKAFAIEVRQLSRVDHPNIVKLYGACTQNPVCLVMEYAEGGSLYNVLHCKPQPRYSAGHAMSWALQCAQGVAYLHNMKPKALIHRDLKPPNLLLVMGGKVLKICDFGTACDKTTYMTNNKGSAAWMAPEVFEGSNYTEKCDVYSWGIILWEVLSRRKPFDDVGGSAFRILWTVHQGERPPLMNGCPQPIEQLMTSCWDKNPSDRPSMDQVVYVMTHLFAMFSGHDDPIQYSSGESYSSQGSDMAEEDVFTDIQTSSFASSQTSVAPSLNGSLVGCEDLTQPIHVDVDPDDWSIADSYIGTPNGGDAEIKERDLVDPSPDSSSTRHEDLDNVYLLLDPQLHPITPDNSCQLSVRVFEQHKQLAQEYLKVQTEIALLSTSMDRLSERLSEAEGLSQLDQQDSERHEEELRRLEDEKENLLKLHDNLKMQLRIIKGRSGNVGEDGWVFVPQQDHSHLT